MRRRLWPLFALLFAAAVSAAHAAGAACPAAPTVRATVAAIGADLDITLTDGRTLALSGLEAPRPTPSMPRRPQDARNALLARFKGREIDWAPLGPSDRWSRYPAIVFAPGDMAAELLEGGVVRLRPDRASLPCRADRLAAEDNARRAGRGVWADPALAVLHVDEHFDRDALPADIEDGLVLVEGVVASVGETPSRVYLNLGRARGGFALVASKRDKAQMESEAFSQARIVGARLRARGLLDHRFGLEMELAGPGVLEILTPAPGSAKP